MNAKRNSNRRLEDNAPHQQQHHMQPSVVDATSINWVTLGAVTGISDEGECRANWAFTAAAVIESKWKIVGHHPLTKLSAQQLVSCVGTPPGCNQLSAQDAWQYLLSQTNGTMVTDALFPYKAFYGGIPACAAVPSKDPASAVIRGIIHMPVNDEASMITHLLKHGPFSVAVDSTSWLTYMGGIMANDCSHEVADHFVTVVGVEQGYEIPYWLVKNTWGVEWGEEGYARVALGADYCLINSQPQTVEIGSAPPERLAVLERARGGRLTGRL